MYICIYYSDIYIIVTVSQWLFVSFGHVRVIVCGVVFVCQCSYLSQFCSDFLSLPLSSHAALRKKKRLLYY